MHFKWHQIFWNTLYVLSITYYFTIIVAEGLISYVNVSLEKVFHIMKCACRTDEYFDRVAQDLEAFAHHAGRKTIDERDAELLLKRYSVPVFILLIFILFLMYE